MIKPVVATIGDGTFYHSGVSPIINAVATGQDMPVVVLDNNWAAMTGYQNNIGTLGGDEIRIPIEKISRGLGVNSVKVVNPYRLRKSVNAYKKLLKGSGVNVLILRGPCVARQPRRAWKLLPARLLSVAVMMSVSIRRSARAAASVSITVPAEPSGATP